MKSLAETIFAGILSVLLFAPNALAAPDGILLRCSTTFLNMDGSVAGSRDAPMNILIDQKGKWAQFGNMLRRDWDKKDMWHFFAEQPVLISVLNFNPTLLSFHGITTTKQIVTGSCEPIQNPF